MNRDEIIYEWQGKIKKHKELLDKGVMHLNNWKELLKQLLKTDVAISNEEESSFTFEFMGQQFKTELEVKSSTFTKGLLSTYIVQVDENQIKSSVKCASQWFDTIGNIGNTMSRESYMIYFTDFLGFIDQYITEENPIKLRPIRQFNPIA